MRYFTLVDFQHWIMALCLGLLAVILVYVAWRLYPDPEEGEESGCQLPSGPARGGHPFPPILIMVYVGAVLWAVGYAVVSYLGGAIG